MASIPFTAGGGRAIAFFALVSVGVAVGAAASQESASQWARGYHSEARLVAGGGLDTAVLVGVQIKLDKGWKTYWRTPGDSGLPPAFDWSQSENVRSATVLWPAPRRLKDGSGTYAGYKDGVVFPVRLEPEIADRPVVARLDLQYAICADICVPAEAKLELTVSKDGGADRTLVERYLAQVPKRVTDSDDALPHVAEVTAVLSAPKPHLIVTARYPKGAAGADLLVEGPEGIYVPMPLGLGSAGAGSVRYKIDLGRGVFEDVKGKSLLFTLVSDAGSSEVSWPVPETGG